MTDNIEQRARDLLNEISAQRRNVVRWIPADTRENSMVLETVCRALEAHDQTQAAFDAYRREVSEKARRADAVIAEMAQAAWGKSLRAQVHEAQGGLSTLIIPEPVDPLVEALCCIVPHINAEPGETPAEAGARQLRAALAKIGGKVVFGEGA